MQSLQKHSLYRDHYLLLSFLIGNMQRNPCLTEKKLSQVKEKCSFNANNNHFFISENLTRMNEVIWYQGRKLKHSNLINAWYSRDGVVTIKKGGCFNPINFFLWINFMIYFQTLILKVMTPSMMHPLMYQLSLVNELEKVCFSV